MLGGLLGGAWQGSQVNQGDQMLGALEGIIGGKPGQGQQLGISQAGSMNMGMNDPIMMMLQPVVDQLAAKVNIPPQIATIRASIGIHYLLSSHPSTSPQAPMNLGSVMQELQSGGLSHDTLHNSGMVNDVSQATGLNKQQSVSTLDTLFKMLAGHVQGMAG